MRNLSAVIQLPQDDNNNRMGKHPYEADGEQDQAVEATGGPNACEKLLNIFDIHSSDMDLLVC